MQLYNKKPIFNLGFLKHNLLIILNKKRLALFALSVFIVDKGN
jgi:hypothetical protein